MVQMDTSVSCHLAQHLYIIWHIPPCIPLVLTRCSRSGAKDCNSKAMASLENNSQSDWRLLDCLGHWTWIFQTRQVVPVTGQE